MPHKPASVRDIAVRLSRVLTVAAAAMLSTVQSLAKIMATTASAFIDNVFVNHATDGSVVIAMSKPMMVMMMLMMLLLLMMMMMMMLVLMAMMTVNGMYVLTVERSALPGGHGNRWVRWLPGA